MARNARIIVPGCPHHITQRGNRRLATFFQNADFDRYLVALRENTLSAGVKVLGYCLMPNHVHLLVIPPDETSLAKAIGETHREYTWETNRQRGWRGCLWQGRFFSCALDTLHLFRAMRYVELNPVRANLVQDPGDYPWSSARAHLSCNPDALLDGWEGFPGPQEWREILARPAVEKQAEELLAKHSRTGRPLGTPDFIQRTERILGRTITPGKRGRKPRGESSPSLPLPPP